MSGIVVTDRIWCIKSGELTIREGELEFDSNFMPNTSPADLLSDFPVESGLHKSDVAVFLAYWALDGTKTTMGYLVRDVFTRDTSGIIVHGDEAERYPREYANTRTYGIWRYLFSKGYSLGEEFGLTSLENYIMTTTPYWHKQKIL